MTIKNLFFSTLISIFFFSCAFADKGHHINVQVNGIQDTIAFMAYHFGNRQYVQDTVRVDQDGRFEFAGEEALDKGMYMIVLPGQVYFEILIDSNQHFGIETTMNEFVNTMEFTDSPQNEAFYEYMRFIKTQGERGGPLRAELQDPSVSDSRKEAIRQELAVLDEAVKEKQNQIIARFPDGLFSKILLAQQEPSMPDNRMKEDGTPDHEYMYQVYKEKFWENIDFSDDRLLRTPVFHAMLNQYFTRVVIQIPDSIIVEADRILEKARANSEVFKYTVFFITNTFEKAQIMGMDAVFVHMVENYYMSGEADWVTEEQLTSISERAMTLKPLLIGKVAPEITMYKRNGQPINLHDVDAKFTVLYFWDSECSHCKKQTPLLREFYMRMKDKGVEIFAANTEADREKWIGYVDKNELNWLNVNDPTNRSGFRDKYDIWATPLLFLLDEDKHIIAKRITIEQMEEIIDRELQRQN